MAESYTDELLDASGWRFPAKMTTSAKARWQATIYRLRAERNEQRERAERAEAKLRVEYCGYSQCTHPNCRAILAKYDGGEHG
jgi:hypothetical protein